MALEVGAAALIHLTQHYISSEGKKENEIF